MVSISNEVLQAIHESQQVAILAHLNPDGDTLGGSFALCYALKKLGKKACVLCHDEVPDKFRYLHTGLDFTPPDGFAPDFVISVDAASPERLGERLLKYQQTIDLCIDHHASNTGFGRYRLIDATAAATCEVMFDLIVALGVTVDQPIANALYTGIATDTGCFKFPNTTPHAHRIAATLMEEGCEYALINRVMFDTKSKSRLMIERYVIDHLTYHFDNKAAVVVVTLEAMQQSEISLADFEGVSVIPRQIEGVDVGITLRERSEGGYKVSVRSFELVDASAVCAAFGGGGHKRAAGCVIHSTAQEAVAGLLEAAKPYLVAVQ